MCIRLTGDLILSQTPVICRYLGKELGLWPETEEDQWHAEQFNTTIHDFIAEGKLFILLKDWVIQEQNKAHAHLDFTEPG